MKQSVSRLFYFWRSWGFGRAQLVYECSKPSASNWILRKMVPEAGLEPARVSPYAPQAYVSAISPPGHRQKDPSNEEAYYNLRLFNVKSCHTPDPIQLVYTWDEN